MNQKEIRNIGIFAHVDAGKTSVTENFLYLSGAIKSLGNVDLGTTQTDQLDVEKERGISVTATSVSFEWDNTVINLIDTPGHIDFSADIERTLRIIDSAILIISAADGIQAQTEAIWNALKERKIPTIVFVNKIDRIGIDLENLNHEISKELGKTLISIQEIENEGSPNAKIINLITDTSFDDHLIETVAETDEDLLNKYLEEETVSFKELEKCYTHAIKNFQITPILFGSSKKNIGISELLNSVIKFFPSPNGNVQTELSALVYGVRYDKKNGKIAKIRIFEGQLKNRELVNNSSQSIEEKITQIRKVIDSKIEILDCAKAGDIVEICGLANAQIGDIIGKSNNHIPKKVSLQVPLLTSRVKPKEEKNYASLAEALIKLSEENPSLDFEWLKEEKELHIKIMGTIQIEVLEKILYQRFDLKVEFEPPSIIYKETPKTKGEGFVRYWMPKPCWAIMKFLIEPGEQGSGVVFTSKVGVNDIKQRYQNEVERTIDEALKQGIKGWEVTDLKITLIEGEDHEMHTKPGDFSIATPMGIMNGLNEIGTTLLEPILSFKIVADESFLGAITSDITQLRGSFESPEIENGKMILTGLLPAATSIDYPVKLSSRSGGKAKYSTQLHSYAPCSDELGMIRPFKGISPLDTAKYILKARKAIQ